MTDLLNRSAVIITPTKKYVQWVRSVDKEHAINASDKEIKAVTNVYLVEEVLTGVKKEIRDIMERNYLDIAIQEFSAWWLVEDDWPVLSSLEAFEQYFGWKLNEVVMNLCNETMDFDQIG